jgi:hypothetical protein
MSGRFRFIVALAVVLCVGAYGVLAQSGSKSYTLVEVTDGAGNVYKGISDGTVELNTPPGGAAMQAGGTVPPAGGQTESGHVPAIILGSRGWLYVTGASPSVGTRYVSIAATGTNLIVEVDEGVHRIYCISKGANAVCQSYRTYGAVISGDEYKLEPGKYLEVAIDGTPPNVNLRYSVGTFDYQNLSNNPAAMAAILQEADQKARDYSLIN